MLEIIITFSVLLSLIPLPLGLSFQFAAFGIFISNLKEGYIDIEDDTGMLFMMWGCFNLSAIPWIFAGRDEVYFVVSISLCILIYGLLHLIFPFKKG